MYAADSAPAGSTDGNGSAAGRVLAARTEPQSSIRHWYPAAVTALVVFLIGLAPGARPSSNPIYLPIGAALAAGALLTLRLRVRARPASLIMPVAVVAYTQLGPSALPLVGAATLLAALVRRVRPAWAFTAAAHDVLAYAVAEAMARAAFGSQEIGGTVLFAIVFAGLRQALTSIAERIEIRAPDLQVERPDLLISLGLAPLGALPVLAGNQLGDGALLVALAALLALLFVVREATNLSTAHAEAAAERERLAQSNALLDDLLHLITHELRNPLTMVRAYTQLGRKALDEGNVEVLASYLANVDRGGRALERLVENLLTLSRVEQEDILPPREEIDIADLVRDVVEDLRFLAESKDQTLAVEVHPGLPAGEAPPMLLREAVSNLVSNAVKYTPSGGRVTVWAGPGDEAGTAEIGVADTGIGLSPEDQSQVFTKFFRSADPRVRQERGSGLGLALTHAIITRMGGRISVESELNKGTTVRLVVPSAPAV